MEFFTIGNFLTLGIVAVILFLYRQFDRHNNAMDKVHKYAAQLKEELTEFVAEKEAAVKDYGISLDVQQKSAKELMRRLKITDEDLALKAAAVAKIDERISAYDASLEELVRMTVRVQENLNRIQEESAFVEKVNKRLGETKEKIGYLEKGLRKIEGRFEQENRDILEKIAQDVTLGVKSRIAEFQSVAEGIERHIRDTREAVEQAEQIRSEHIDRDLNLINKTLEEAIEKAAAKADKLEDGTLIKLQEQALERVQHIRSLIEEKIKTHQEDAQVRVAELHNSFIDHIGTWKNDAAELEIQHRSQKDTWEKDIQEMNDRIEAQHEAWELAVEDGNAKVQHLFTDLNSISEESKERLGSEIGVMEQRLKEVQSSTEVLVKALEQRILISAEETERKALEVADERLEKWKLLTMEADANIRRLLSDLGVASTEIKTHFREETTAVEQDIHGLQIQIDDAMASFQDQVMKVAVDTEARVLEDARARLEQWKQAVEEGDAKSRVLLSGLEASTLELKTYFTTETMSIEQRLRDLQGHTDERIAALRDQVARTAEDLRTQVWTDTESRLGQWKQDMEENDARVQQLFSDLEIVSVETEKHISHEISEATEQLQTLQAKIDGAASNIENEIANASERVLALADAEFEKWKQSLAIEDAKARQLLSALKTSLEDTKEEVSDEMASTARQIQALQTQIDETVSHIAGEMIKAMNSAELRASTLADAGLEKWKQAIKTEDTKAQELRSALEKISAETEKHISDKLTAMGGQFEAIQARIQETAARIEEEMAKAVSNAEVKALALTDTGLEKWKRTAEEGDTRARQLLADVERISMETRAHALDEIAGAATQLEALQHKINNIAARIEGEMTQAVSNGEAKASALAGAELKKWRLVMEEGDLKIQALLTNLEAASKDSEQNLMILEQRLIKITEDRERKALEDGKAQLKAWKTTAEEADARIRKLLSDMEISFTDTKKQISDEILGAETQIGTLQDRLGETVSLIEQKMALALDNAEIKALAVADTGLEKWKKAAEEEDARIRKVLTDLGIAFTDTKKQVSNEIATMERRMETLQKRIDDAASLVDHEMALVIGNAKERALLAAKEEDDKTRSLLSDLETVFTDAKKYIFDEITVSKIQIGTLQKQIDETNTHIEDELAKAVGNAEATALALADRGIEKWKQTIEAEDTKVRQLLADLETAAAESEKNMAALEQRLVKITGDMEQRVLGVTDERLEYWNIITAEAETNTRRLLVDLEAASEEIKTHFTVETVNMEQRLKNLQGYADEVMRDLKVQVDKTVRDTEQRTLEDMRIQLENWKRLAEEEDARVRQLILDSENSFTDTKKYISNEITRAEGRFEDLQNGINETSSLIEQKILAVLGNAERQALKIGQKVLEETDEKFEEYRIVQREQFQRLETLADDTARLDAELRRYMTEIENRVRDDFLRFEHNSVQDRDKISAEFTASAQGIKTGLEAVERELADLKVRAYQNISEKFQIFEDDFSIDLAKKSAAIEQRLREWQETLNEKFAGFIQESETRYRNTEHSFNEALRNQFVEQHERLVSEMEHLKVETGNFEEGIRSQMKSADDSLNSFKAQLHQDIEDARNTADASVKAELGRYALSIADTLKENQRDLETQVKRIADQTEARNYEITGLFETSRQELDKWQTGFNTELQGLDASMNDVRRRAQELITESDERLSSIRSAMTDVNKEAAVHRIELFSYIDDQVKILDSAIKEADRHIKEFAAQTRLFERTDELKLELERRLEDLRGDFDRIDQRRVEAIDMEGQFVKIKRLEDEVNTKMTRFLSEKYRIEQMEIEFNRLLQVSIAVEEKLTEVSNSDDALQGIQIQIRKLNDALEDAEEKYRRIEKKNQILDTTNDGIDRNFKSLQESEKLTRYITDEMNRLSTELGSLRSSIETLTAENIRARETAEKLSLLDTSLSSIEERIDEMQKARQWLAKAETRLEDLNKQSQDQVKLMGTLMKDPGKIALEDRGAPPLGVRENVIKLAQLGWTVDEIARAVKRSRGEVELILELMPKE